jgi:uncharacterized protein (TIGR03435 family)
MRNSLLAALTILAGTLLAAGPEFDVASIKPSTPSRDGRIFVGCKGGPGSTDPVSFSCQNMSLANLITLAYALAPYQFSAPPWLSGERFDINVKIPERTAKEDFVLMQRNLLAERFQLTIHHETKEMAQYNLVLANNGPKFKEAAPAASPSPASPRDTPPAPGQIQKDKDGFPILPAGRAGMIMTPGRARWQAVGQTMEQITRTLSVQAAAPVRDLTGLTGKYDFTLSWNPEPAREQSSPLPSAKGGLDAPAPEADYAPSLFDAVQGQLGLRLEKKRAAVDMLVVDHVEKVPTEN